MASQQVDPGIDGERRLHDRGDGYRLPGYFVDRRTIAVRARAVCRSSTNSRRARSKGEPSAWIGRQRHARRLRAGFAPDVSRPAVMFPTASSVRRQPEGECTSTTPLSQSVGRELHVLHVTPAFHPATYWGGPIHSVYGLCNAIA